MKRIYLLAVAVLALGVSAAYGHGGHIGSHVPGSLLSPDAFIFGHLGDPKKVDTEVRVEMSDRQCRLQTDVRLRQGQTARFVARNGGTKMHELVLGTSHELAQHALQGANDPHQDHDEPYIVHVEPGATEVLVWRFTRVGLYGYGCLIHGMDAARMQGRITITR